MSDKDFAEESEKTKRAREKLRKQLEKVDSQITDKALEQKSLEIHRWISRHAPSRIVLRTKTISLFDENRNTADTSSRIEKLALNLRKEFQIT